MNKQEALNKIKELQEYVEGLGKAWPQKGDRYCVPYAGSYTFPWGAAVDKFYQFTNAMHRTEKSANKHMEIIKRMVELRGDWRPDIRNEGQRKYYIERNASGGAFCCDRVRFYIRQGAFYLPTKEAAQAVIDEFGDDLMVLFGEEI